MSDRPIQLSIVVPAKDEAENVAPLAREIAAAIRNEAAHEIIFVDDGSADTTAQELLKLKREMPELRVITHARNAGQSRAIRTGVRAAKGSIVVTLDGDGQNDPADIPKLLAALRAGVPGVALVSGVRVNRKDTLFKRFTSRIANAFRGWVLGDHAKDVGCSLKAFRRDVFLALPYFDNIHRFIIPLILREGYEVRFVDVNHRPRTRGASKYNMRNRLFVGLTDLAGVLWLKRRYRGPVESKEL